MTKKSNKKNIEDSDAPASAKGREHEKKSGGRKHDKSGKKTSEKNHSGTQKKAEPVIDERYLRLQADFENFRKRVLREKDELYSRANEDIIQELLPVLDHLEMALAAAGEHKGDPVVEGFRLVGEQLRNALKKFGLTEIESAGCEFDPNVHEAIMHMPSDEVEENHIVSDARKGYMLGSRLLRASQVVVSSGAPADAGDAAADDGNSDKTGE